jgi:YesN/AraC family two-component response regulator
VAEAADAREARTRFRPFDPDLVVPDVVIPGINGVGVHR